MSVVIDTSLLVDLGGEQRAAIRSLIGGRQMHAPELIVPETVNALRRLVRTGTWSFDAANSLVHVLQHKALRLHGHRALAERLWSLRDRITPYDASYVALAERLRAPLLTTDRRLARAAGDLIEVVLPE